MGLIILEVLFVAALISFVVFMAMDDRRNQRIRAEEDRVKALEQDKASRASNDVE